MNTPLHHAVMTRNPLLVERLIEHDANVNAMNALRKTPKDLADNLAPGTNIANILRRKDQTFVKQHGVKTVGDGKGPLKREERLACKSCRTTVTEIYSAEEGHWLWHTTISVQELVYGEGSLDDLLRQVRPEDLNDKSPLWIWLHFPENNMIWLEDLFKKLKINPAIWHDEKGTSSASLRNRAITPHVSTGRVAAVFTPFVSYEEHGRQMERQKLLQKLETEQRDRLRRKASQLLLGLIPTVKEQVPETGWVALDLYDSKWKLEYDVPREAPAKLRRKLRRRGRSIVEGLPT